MLTLFVCLVLMLCVVVGVVFDFGCMSVSSCFGCCVSENGVSSTEQYVSVDFGVPRVV